MIATNIETILSSERSIEPATVADAADLCRLFAADGAVRRAVISPRRSEKSSTRGTGDIVFTLPRDIPARRVEGWYFSRAFLAEERRVAPKEKPSVHGAVVSDCR
jgi:hypothetical protein